MCETTQARANPRAAVCTSQSQNWETRSLYACNYTHTHIHTFIDETQAQKKDFSNSLPLDVYSERLTSHLKGNSSRRPPRLSQGRITLVNSRWWGTWRVHVISMPNVTLIEVSNVGTVRGTSRKTSNAMDPTAAQTRLSWNCCRFIKTIVWIAPFSTLQSPVFHMCSWTRVLLVRWKASTQMTVCFGGNQLPLTPASRKPALICCQTCQEGHAEEKNIPIQTALRWKHTELMQPSNRGRQLFYIQSTLS